MLSITLSGFAQSKISLHVGSTFSKVRALYDKGAIQPGPYFESAVNLPILTMPYFGFEYEYSWRKLHLSTGLVLINLGADVTPYFPIGRWNTPYWTIPIMAGYRLNFPHQWALIGEAGGELGLSDKGYAILMGGGSYWGNINAVAGVEAEYKRWRLGIRLQWGLTDFRYAGAITYKHAAVTTYLSYTLWDHAKAKAERLQKQQEALLTP